VCALAVGRAERILHPSDYPGFPNCRHPGLLSSVSSAADGTSFVASRLLAYCLSLIAVVEGKAPGRT